MHRLHNLPGWHDERPASADGAVPPLEPDTSCTTPGLALGDVEDQPRFVEPLVFRRVVNV